MRPSTAKNLKGVTRGIEEEKLTEDNQTLSAGMTRGNELVSSEGALKLSELSEHSLEYRGKFRRGGETEFQERAERSMSEASIKDALIEANGLESKQLL